MSKIDPNTGRPFGDHGTAQDAIDFILDYRVSDFGPGEESDFLEGWNEGDLKGYPEFYDWLKEKEAKDKADAKAAKEALKGFRL